MIRINEFWEIAIIANLFELFVNQKSITIMFYVLKQCYTLLEIAGSSPEQHNTPVAHKTRVVRLGEQQTKNGRQSR